MKIDEFRQALEKVGVEWYDYLRATDLNKGPSDFREVIAESDNPKDALFASFPWDETEQKHEYWADVAKALEDMGK